MNFKGFEQANANTMGSKIAQVDGFTLRGADSFE